MKKVLLLAAGCIFLYACNNEKKDDKQAEKPAIETTTPQSEILSDAKYTDLGKSFMNSLASGDMAGYGNAYADTAKYFWNGGDSLVGKPAIVDYWTKRRHDVIDSLKYSQDIWLPVKVNRPQQHEMTGVWLMAWHIVTAKYKTGKSMTQWMHMLLHFNSVDKIDQVLQFVDKVPINAAASK